ncbi:MAG: hypothetical protein SOU50_04645 [Oscillospiraceae bacterium]|nr:hypothetical protein [Oscillospiraceae bacterium]MDY2847490.1 hypothetical protein [Oscillospiraceae bacterium]
MLSELTLIITENTNEIIQVKYALDSVCPYHGTTRLDIAELLSGYEDNRGNMQYLGCAAAVFEILCRGGKLHCISSENGALLEKIFKLYSALSYESHKQEKQMRLLEEQCTDMLRAANRIAGIIRNHTFETLTAKDLNAMKSYIKKNIPPVSELMGYPPDIMDELRPVFDLMRLLVDFSPTDPDRKYIENIFRTFYS